MRPLHVILAVSLAANIGLAFVCIKARNPAPSSAAARMAAKSRPAAGAPAVDPVLLANALITSDVKTLHAQLLALGFSEANARALAMRVLWLPYYEKQRELRAAKNGPDKPYWQDSSSSAASYTAGERKELRDLASKIRQKALEAFGTNIGDTGAEAASARYSFLPQEKIAMLLDLQRDYGEMGAEIREESNRFKLPSDAGKQRLLYEEFQKDIKAALTPEEFAAYEQRFSPTAQAARRSFATIEATEAEYLAAYNAMKAVDNEYPMTAQAPGRETLAARSKAYREAFAEIKNILGEERYAAFQRAQNSDYRNLQAAADRFQIPAGTINNVYNLRDTASAESQRITADTALSADDKKQALKNLAAQIKAQVRSQLGEEVGDAYLEKNMMWLQRMSSDGTPARFSAR